MNSNRPGQRRTYSNGCRLIDFWSSKEVANFKKLNNCREGGFFHASHSQGILVSAGVEPCSVFNRFFARSFSFSRPHHASW
jgi:hypothetical protein